MAQYPYIDGNIGAPPQGMWDPARANQEFAGKLEFTGGSLPEEGHFPGDDHPGAPSSVNASTFYGLPLGRPSGDVV